MLGFFSDVNDCANQPCKNGGVCRDLDGDYTCHCPSPYVGKQCHLRMFTSCRVILVHALSLDAYSLILYMCKGFKGLKKKLKYSTVLQVAFLCWGWKEEQSWSRRFPLPLCTTASWVSSAGGQSWLDSTTRASSTPGRQPPTTGTPGSR